MRFRLLAFGALLALLAFGALIWTAHTDVAPLPLSLMLPPPQLPQPPLATLAPPAPLATPAPLANNVAPQVLQSLRIAGTMAIVPDDATKTAIVRAGKARTITTIKLCMATDGAINLIKILKPSGFAAYDQKIVNTIRDEWKYKPYMVDGTPAPVCTAVTFIYAQ